MENRFEVFMGLMTGIGRSIRRIKSTEMADFHLKGTHALCLYYLYKEGALTATELCERCEEDKANVSRIIEYLKKQGYLLSVSEAEKRYRTPLTLTEKGREAGGALVDKIDCVLSLSDEGIAPEDLKTMYETLTKVNENLQRLCDRYEAQNKEEI